VVRLGFPGRLQRFERHAAERAVARTIVADLRVHRAGMDNPGLGESGRCDLGLEMGVRSRHELGPAASPAEMEHLPPWSKRCFEVAGSTFIPQTGSNSCTPTETISRQSVWCLFLTRSCITVIYSIGSWSISIGNYSDRCDLRCSVSQ
jgi:hypothetical protein